MTYNRLGGAAFFTLLLRSSWVLTLALFALGGLALLLVFVPPQLSMAVTVLLWTGAALALAGVGGTIAAAWLQYSHMSITLKEEVLVFRRGFIVSQEISVPYSSIAQIERAAGGLVITIAADDNRPAQLVRIEPLGKKMALRLREEISARLH